LLVEAQEHPHSWRLYFDRWPKSERLLGWRKSWHIAAIATDGTLASTNHRQLLTRVCDLPTRSTRSATHLGTVLREQDMHGDRQRA
jgi:hypothetical protein